MKEQILIDALEKIKNLDIEHLDYGSNNESCPLCIATNALQAFHSTGKDKGLKWVSVEDRPLFTKDKDDCWTLTDDGGKEFLAAVPYGDSTRPDEKNLWWIRHCIIDDGGLKIVGDVDNEPAGWSLEDVTHYMLLPKPPGDESIEGEDRDKELAELKGIHDGEINLKDAAIVELSEEIEKLRGARFQDIKQIERLKGLLRKEYDKGLLALQFRSDTLDKMWEQFSKNNNL